MTKVLKTFKDKITNEIFKAGQIYEGDRAEELAELGFVEGDKAKKTKTKADKASE